MTADFVYIRLHGDKELYKSGYSDAALNRWAERIRAWSTGTEPGDAKKASPQTTAQSISRDVFCFFDNTDAKLRAPQDARTLMRKLGVTLSTSTGHSDRLRKEPARPLAPR